MTARAIDPQRRGACPGLSAPMATGDGLLVRLMPTGTIPRESFTALCAAAQTFGNGVIEITARGSIQVRGLSSASAPEFAAAVAALGIAATDGIAVSCNPLSGLAADEILDAGKLAADLRLGLARRSLAARLGAKVSIAIDGGGALNVDGIAADVRLRAAATNGGVVLGVGIGGDGTSAMRLGSVTAAHGVEAATRLLEVLARRGRDARARDIIAAGGMAAFRAAVADLIIADAPPTPARRSADAIGMHRLRDGSLACGIGLAFGHAGAELLARLAEAATTAGAYGLRTAGRALLAIGLTQDTAVAFAADAARLGFVVRADDPRRHVVACAGAPICASAEIASRAIAPRVADSMAAFLDGSFTIHISGCAKGCAHAAAAALTIVGTPAGCGLIADGCARDVPFAVVPPDELSAAIASVMANKPPGRQREGRHG